MNPDEIVKALRAYVDANIPHTEEMLYRVDAANAADLIESLQAELEIYRGFPNEPLTLDELRGMDGQPVWESWTGAWRIVIMAHDGETVSLYNAYNTISAKSVLYSDGRIYRRPPERSEDNE